MKQKYEIKGIEKIIHTAGKERLAKYYEVDIDSDFEKIIMKDFKKHHIPNGLEVALYFSLTPEEYNKRIEQKGAILDEQSAALEVYEQDEEKRGMFGINYMGQMPKYDENYNKMVDGTWGNVLYFFVDEPIKLEGVYAPRHFIGGIHYKTLYMGNEYYEKHKEELEQFSSNKGKVKAVDNYLENFMNEYKNVEYTGGYGPRKEYQETDEIREEKAKNEKIILDLTGKSSIEELSLKDYIALRRRLEKEEQELQKQFEEKFTKKEEGVRE